MAVGTLCNRDVVVTNGDSSVAEAAALMREFHVGDVVVLDDGDERRPIGLVTDRDVTVAVVALGLDPEQLTARDIMSKTLVTVSEDEDFWEALAVMRKHGIRRLPVVNDRQGLEGILTLDDALALVSEAMADLVVLVSREIDHEKTTRKHAPS
jgi:CBS domain-containing protein